MEQLITDTASSSSPTLKLNSVAANNFLLLKSSIPGREFSIYQKSSTNPHMKSSIYQQSLIHQEKLKVPTSSPIWIAQCLQILSSTRKWTIDWPMQTPLIENLERVWNNKNLKNKSQISACTRSVDVTTLLYAASSGARADTFFSYSSISIQRCLNGIYNIHCCEYFKTWNSSKMRRSPPLRPAA